MATSIHFSYRPRTFLILGIFIFHVSHSVKGATIDQDVEKRANGVKKIPNQSGKTSEGAVINGVLVKMDDMTLKDVSGGITRISSDVEIFKARVIKGAKKKVVEKQRSKKQQTSKKIKPLPIVASTPASPTRQAPAAKPAGDPVAPVIAAIIKESSSLVVGTINEGIIEKIIQEIGNNFIPGAVDFLGDTVANYTRAVFRSPDSTKTLTGTFHPGDGEKIQSFFVNVYSETGICTASSVDSSTGNFVVSVTDIPVGMAPYIIIFSKGVYCTNPAAKNNRRNLNSMPNAHLINSLPESTPARIMTSANMYNSPTVIWCVNQGTCSAAITFTLTWDGPTSDLDLHVFEPTSAGKHVFFSSKSGKYGYLDVDDINGFGPENYIAATLPQELSGLYFVTQVHAFSMNSDFSVTYTLEAKKGEAQVWLKTGIFTSTDQSADQWSEQYTVPVDATVDSCQHCRSPEYPRGLRVARTLINWSDEPDQCKVCPIPKFTGCCSYWFVNFFCKCTDIEKNYSQRYKTYQSLKSNTKPSVAEAKFYMMTLIAPFLGKYGPWTYFNNIYEAIEEKPKGSQFYPLCIKYEMMLLLCKMQFWKGAQDYLAAIALIPKTIAVADALRAGGLASIPGYGDAQQTFLNEFVTQQLILPDILSDIHSGCVKPD